ncbi:hypothetical protein F4604DRAFT_1936668 [Suillus subluteus]|nr:hypothetical protein F4604DRAFT_1936668 [Suillus subluteus]
MPSMIVPASDISAAPPSHFMLHAGALLRPEEAGVREDRKFHASSFQLRFTATTTTLSNSVSLLVVPPLSLVVVPPWPFLVVPPRPFSLHGGPSLAFWISSWFLPGPLWWFLPGLSSWFLPGPSWWFLPGLSSRFLPGPSWWFLPGLSSRFLPGPSWWFLPGLSSRFLPGPSWWSLFGLSSRFLAGPSSWSHPGSSFWPFTPLSFRVFFIYHVITYVF